MFSEIESRKSEKYWSLLGEKSGLEEEAVIRETKEIDGIRRITLLSLFITRNRNQRILRGIPIERFRAKRDKPRS